MKESKKKRETRKSNEQKNGRPMIGWISLGFSLVALALAGFTFHFNYLKPFVLKCSVGSY